MAVFPLTPCHQAGAGGPGGHRVDHLASVVLECFT